MGVKNTSDGSRNTAWDYVFAGTALAVGASRALDCMDVFSNASCQFSFPSAPASQSLNLEGSMDGSNWTILATSTATTLTTLTSTGVVFRLLRVNVTAAAGGSSPTITAIVSAQAATFGGATSPSTVTANQGTRGAASNAWPTYITNQAGTNLVTVDSSGGLGVVGARSTPYVGGTLFVQGTDGTNVTPAGDAVARAIFQKLTDGTNVAGVDAPTGGGVTGNALLVSAGNVVAGTSLTAATSGNGTSVDFGSSASFISCVFTNSGTTSGGTVNLQVSVDGAFWLNVGTALNASTLAVSGTATLATNAISVANVGFRFARAVVASAITGSGTVSASISAS